MPERSLSTPVAFIIFNRPDVTARVFAEIAKARPPKLLVIADGPRADRAGEAALCAQTRAIIEQVDWPCEVLTQYSDRNLGCRRRVSSGLNWVFEMVEEAIILEDDCLPDQSFFRFCEELLTRYRDDLRVMQISGDNFHFGQGDQRYSYYFSRRSHIWGWASWRRAWNHYDVRMSQWPQFRDGAWLAQLLGGEQAVRRWRRNFDAVYEGRVDTWDYQWTFAIWSHDGLVIQPTRNLVSNIGFGPRATHTKLRGQLANMVTESLDFPLRHPPKVAHDRVAETLSERMIAPLPASKRLLQQVEYVARGQSSLSDFAAALGWKAG
jgi:hypothetical protein